MTRLQIPHLRAIQIILWYIKETWIYGVLYKKSRLSHIFSFVDNDLARNIKGVLPTKSFVFFLSNRLIMWMSKKQSSVALSSIEANYVAISSP